MAFDWRNPERVVPWKPRQRFRLSAIGHGAEVLLLLDGQDDLAAARARERGARVVMVETDRAALAELERNRAALDATQVSIVGADAEAYLARDHEREVDRPSMRFDVVFLDPPFGQNVLPAILGKIAPRLEPGARVYVESEAPVDAPPPWSELKRARAGQVSYQLLQWNAGSAIPAGEQS